MPDYVNDATIERQKRRRQIQRRGKWLFLLGTFFLLVWIWVGEPGRPSDVLPVVEPIISPDIDQPRLNTAVPVPQGNFHVEQSFVARHDGLREIELILVRHGEPLPDEDGRFTLTLFDASGSIIAQRNLPVRTLKHNQLYTFQFPPQRDAAGQRYVLRLSGSQDNPVTVWGYDLDVYDGGDISFVTDAGEDDPETTVQDFRFVTRYQLTWSGALAALGQSLIQNGWLMLLALVFIPLPGCLLLQTRPLRWQGWDKMAWWGAAFACGTAVWPLLWFWFSLIGGRWSGWLLWLLLVLGWAAVIWQGWKKKNTGTEKEIIFPPLPRPAAPYHILLLLILIIGLAVRLLAVRDLTVPPWVDSSRHALITAVMAESGRTLVDYTPYLPVTRFPYHFGFHTISTSLFLMTNGSLNQLLLSLGQLLNALVPLTVYAGTWLITRQRNTSVLAAFLVALPFFFPGYYATWGRFTQLTAMLIMPVALAFTWLLVRGSKRWSRAWWVLGVLAAGLFLIHFRVFLFYVPFTAVVWIMSRGRRTRWLAAGTGLALLLVVPRIIYLFSITEPARILSSNLPGYNDFPAGYYNAGWDRFFIWAAAAAFIFLFGEVIQWRRWAALSLALVLWVWLLFFALSGDYLGLPSTRLVNLNSMYITLFLPLAIFLTLGAKQTWQRLTRAHWLIILLGYVAAGGVGTAVLLFGIRLQINILNPDTILVQNQDVVALQWIDEHLPAEAQIAVNSWKWLGNAWAGNDGGAWIVPLTGRMTSTPPADYSYDRALSDTVNSFNEAATPITDWAAPETAAWLREQGMTHVFVGARGGFMEPSALARNPNLNMLYSHDGVFVFEIIE